MKQKYLLGRTFRAAAKASVPVMAGYLVLGAAFGILLARNGYGAGWALLMSGCIYAGSMQFVTVDLLARGATLVSAALMTLLVNARHVLYGISMLEKYRDTGKAKPYLVFSLTDETYALLCAAPPADVQKNAFYFFVSALNQLYWIAGSVAGAALGSLLTIDTTGIDFAMTALFIVIFTEQWLSAKDHFPALLGVGVTAACLIVFGPERFLIPAMLAILAVLSARSLRQRGHENA